MQTPPTGRIEDLVPFAPLPEWRHCPCGCSHVIGLNDNGPCSSPHRGANGRCVYCDHALWCHAQPLAPSRRAALRTARSRCCMARRRRTPRGRIVRAVTR